MERREARRAHVNLTVDGRETLDRLVHHLEAAHPERRITASAAIRYAISKTASGFDAVAAI